MAYLQFTQVGDTGKTKRFAIKSNDLVLGHIQWYAPWRRYAMFATTNTIFDSGCLNEIINFIDGLMLARKRKGIPVEQEPPELFKEFKCSEKCVFCLNPY